MIIHPASLAISLSCDRILEGCQSAATNYTIQLTLSISTAGIPCTQLTVTGRGCLTTGGLRHISHCGRIGPTYRPVIAFTVFQWAPPAGQLWHPPFPISMSATCWSVMASAASYFNKRHLMARYNITSFLFQLDVTHIS